ncbi:hypothetical protein EYC80_006822 [Monilinia laxa]|uniref:Uncharacterized protein n=1 Tax=Monilinia laxa TaxID=61186 RepID=A0A5N6JZ99_MONLA|nr:hypothetical protein EYC80_006822 [Monilinia laxa]
MNCFICGYLGMTSKSTCKGCEGFLPGLTIIGRVEVNTMGSKPAATTLEESVELWIDPSTAVSETKCFMLQITVFDIKTWVIVDEKGSDGVRVSAARKHESQDNV